MSFWIDTASPLQLAIAPRPQGGEWLHNDIRQLKHEGIDILVSLLSYQETRELDLDEEKAACSSVGITFVNFPFPDRMVPPSRLGFLTFAQFLHKRATEGLRIGAHCRACIGRSSVLLATVMRLEGFTAQEAFDRISNARGVRVPDTAQQARWVTRLSI
jgi:protein-tyrosine phosphatase